MPEVPPSSSPRVGMLATVRNRRCVVSAVEPYDGNGSGRLHLVTVEYADPDDQLIWELEIGAKLVEPTALPDPARTQPMRHDHFDALVRASRWSALTPFVDPDDWGALGRLPLTAPLHGAVQVGDFQLVPLQKVLRMPRASEHPVARLATRARPPVQASTEDRSEILPRGYRISWTKFLASIGATKEQEAAQHRDKRSPQSDVRTASRRSRTPRASDRGFGRRARG